MKKYDAVIIGYGPAGISASLYIQRAGLKSLVIGKDFGALTKAESIDNYYGLEKPLSGVELAKAGIDQAKALGAEVVTDEVFGITWNGDYVISCANGEYSATAVIMATGSSRKTVKIPGVKEFEGRGVSYCAVCDAFFYRNKDVAVLGNTQYAMHEASELINIASSVTLLTDGLEIEGDTLDGLKVIDKKLKSVYGDEKFSGVEFEDGEKKEFAGLFIALGSAGTTDLARKAGANLNGNSILVNENMETGLPGLYAAGDCVGGILQVSVAVSEGAKSAMNAIKYIRAQKKGE